MRALKWETDVLPLNYRLPQLGAGLDLNPYLQLKGKTAGGEGLEPSSLNITEFLHYPFELLYTRKHGGREEIRTPLHQLFH